MCFIFINWVQQYNSPNLKNKSKYPANSGIYYSPVKPYTLTIKQSNRHKTHITTLKGEAVMKNEMINEKKIKRLLEAVNSSNTPVNVNAGDYDFAEDADFVEV